MGARAWVARKSGAHSDKAKAQRKAAKRRRKWRGMRADYVIYDEVEHMKDREEQWAADGAYGEAKHHALSTGDYDEPDPPPDPAEYADLPGPMPKRPPAPTP